MEQTIHADLLVIGAGLAGERAAVEAAIEGLDVRIITVVPPRRSHSSSAQGGMQAAFGFSEMSRGDSSDEHFRDTVRGSDWGCDQRVARIFAENAASAVMELDSWGVPWTRISGEENAGLIASRNFGGTAKWRACFCADGTGHSVMTALDSSVARLKIPVYDRCEAFSLIIDEGFCTGAIVLDLRTGEILRFIAKAVVIATGGLGQIFNKTTNSLICDGTGQAMVLATGAGVLANMEAVQFHPTATASEGLLITEGCRGDGGFLLDSALRRFMPDYEPELKDLAPRDIVARRMMQHIRKGAGVNSPWGDHLWLDIRHLGEKHIENNLREVRELCMNFIGIDPVRELIPVCPAQHYTMGGIRTDIDCSCGTYGVKGLFAAGEAACWDLHGFNRLGGNSLAETVVAGKIAGKNAAEWIRSNAVPDGNKAAEREFGLLENRIRKLLEKDGNENCYLIKNEMRKILSDNAGIFRSGEGLRKALSSLKMLSERETRISVKSGSAGFAAGISDALKIRGMLRIAICITKGALLRKESRGAHFREDFPARNDKEWLKRSLFRWPDGYDEPEVFYENVDVSVFPPENRGA